MSVFAKTAVHLLQYLVTHDPEMLRPPEVGTAGPEVIAEPWHLRAEEDLAALRSIWLDVQAGVPVVPEPSHLTAAASMMRAASTWTARHPEHPALAAIRAQLGLAPLFLMLGRQALFEDQDRYELVLPGVRTGLYILDRSGRVPGYAEEEYLGVSGLLGVAHSLDTRHGVAGLEVVIWPLAHLTVDRMVAATGEEGSVSATP